MKDSHIANLLVAIIGMVVCSASVVAVVQKRADVEQKEKDRAAYMYCLTLTEKLINEKPDRISLPHCSK